jgi:hypothetical protein
MRLAGILFMGRRTVAKHITKLASMALTLCLHQVSGAQAPAPALSPDATIAYINTALHNYPTLEFVASGCSGDEQVVTISEDRRSLLIKQNFALPVEGGRCDNVQTLTVPIFSLHLEAFGRWTKQAQHTAFALDCTDNVECFSSRPDARTTASGASQWHLKVTAPDQLSDRFEKALHHLLASLLAEADAHVAANDPFAKRAH